MSKVKIRTRFVDSIKKVSATNPELAEALRKVYELAKKPGEDLILLRTEADLKKAFPQDENSKEESTEEEVPEEEKDDKVPIDSDAEQSDADQRTKKIVMDLLEELGLVEKTEGMVKNVAPNLYKTAISDIAKIALAVEQLAEQISKISAGPVLRELGPIGAPEIQAQQQADLLKKMISETKDPVVLQQLRNQLAQLDIKLIQSRSKTT
jgi:hypothetical protein